MDQAERCKCGLRAEIAARAAPQADEGLREHEPGESHHYGPLVCSVCGQQGTIRLSIEPQTAAAAAPVPADGMIHDPAYADAVWDQAERAHEDERR